MLVGMEKTLLFSLDRSNFEFSYFRAGGKGGQAQNKTSSGCRVKHPPSGAVAESREFRDQLSNKRAAWRKCVQSNTFQSWLRMEIARRNMTDLQKKARERELAEWMNDDNIKVEFKAADGTWHLAEDMLGL